MLIFLVTAALAGTPAVPESPTADAALPTDAAALAEHLERMGLRPVSDAPWPAWSAAGAFTRVDGRCVRVDRTAVGQLQAQVCPVDRDPCGATFDTEPATAAIPCRGRGPTGPVWVLAESDADRIALRPALNASVSADTRVEVRTCTAASLGAIDPAAPPAGVALASGTRTCGLSGPPALSVTPIVAGAIGGVFGGVVSADIAIDEPNGRRATREPPVDCTVPCPPTFRTIHAPRRLTRPSDPAALLFRTAEACEAAEGAGELPFLRDAVCEDPGA